VEVLDARALVGVAGSAVALDALASEGGGAVVVDLRVLGQLPAADRSAVGDALDRLAGAPVVVVAIAAGTGEAAAADVVVGDADAAAEVVAAVDAHPLAATALALHLRASEPLGVEDALVAESAVYSMLQAGPEHRRWLDGRDVAGRRREGDDGERARLERDRDGDRVTITLARPAVRNAVDAAMQRALVDAFLVAAEDGAAEVVVRADGPVFSAGGDLREFGSLADPASAHLLRLARSPARALHRLGARSTVHVHGACHGAGVELPAFAHRVVARPDTTFALPEVAMGLVPGAGGTVSIPRRIGRHRAAWLALTGRTIDAPTALAWGLVDAVDDGT
jgi:hypothetical protein